MKKILISFLYLVSHPLRALEIFKLYSQLHGKYKFTIILSHAYREYIYKNRSNLNKNQKKNNLILKVGNIKEEIQTIINIHDGTLRSGGLTDRLKGMCTLYMFAKRNNYQFKIFFTHPFELQKYLMPNKYNWIIEENDIIYNLKDTAIYTWENEEFSKSFFKLNSNKKQLHINCNSRESFQDYSNIFHQLFKPTPFLEEVLNIHLKQLGGIGNYISISLRFQNLLGEFKEAHVNSLNEDDINLLIEQCLSKIKQLKNNHLNIEKILITSDSNKFREIAKSKLSFIYTYVIPEEIGHLDYTEAGKSKELTAFLDMYLIANAKKAYQIRNQEMYNSDFPTMAAKINNVPYEMILIK